jgi:hypothetical protein
MLNCTKLDDLAIGWGQNRVRVGVEWAYPRLEGTIEEGGEVRVHMQVGFRYF